MQNDYTNLDIWDDDDGWDIPEYEDTPATPEETAYAQSLVGKWVINKPDSEFQFGKKGLLGYVFKQNINRDGYAEGGGHTGQVFVRLFQWKNMWSFFHWKLMWQENVTYNCYDSSWLVPTDQRPSLKERISRLAYLVCRYPVTSFLKTRFDIKNYGFFFRDTRRFTNVAMIYAGFYDLGYALKYGVGK